MKAKRHDLKRDGVRWACLNRKIVEPAVDTNITNPDIRTPEIDEEKGLLARSINRRLNIKLLYAVQDSEEFKLLMELSKNLEPHGLRRLKTKCKWKEDLVDLVEIFKWRGYNTNTQTPVFRVHRRKTSEHIYYSIIDK